ncbi:DNA-directed RNA polymerase subunit E'' [Candidatus Woesearchaeota archaeon]|nr:DNA-directed RNA polymerase subunit E'' [Candidatus Woesearchaeota archaeon]
MSKKKVCKVCKVFVTGEQCQLCKGNQFSNNWKGRVTILNVEKSEIAKKIGVTNNGEYSIKSN